MVAARKRENQNRINDKLHLFFYGKKTLQYICSSNYSLFPCVKQTIRVTLFLFFFFFFLFFLSNF